MNKCVCAYTAPYVCRYCLSKTSSWLSIMWKGVMSVINAKGKIRAERIRRTALRYKKHGDK